MVFTVAFVKVAEEKIRQLHTSCMSGGAIDLEVTQKIGNSRLIYQLSVSQEGLYSIGLFGWLINYLVNYSQLVEVTCILQNDSDCLKLLSWNLIDDTEKNHRNFFGYLTLLPEYKHEQLCHNYNYCVKLSSGVLQEMRKELLKHADWNIVVVDWAGGSLPLYTQATANTRLVGLELAHLINHLQVMQLLVNMIKWEN